VETTTPPSTSVARLLAKITRDYEEAKPRVHIVNAGDEILLNWGESTLPLPIVGITRLYTTAMVLREFDRGALTPETLLADVLPPDIFAGICVLGDSDYSNEITLAHLLAHTSGVTDFYDPPQRGVVSLFRQSLARDRAWSLEQALEISRHYPGRFRPGARKAVHYSSTNYMLLGAVLSASTGMSFEQLINLRIVGPLGLKNTLVFTPAHFAEYFSLTPVLWGKKVLRIPHTQASFGAAGSLVTTPPEAVRFMRAFWSGELFNPAWLPRLTEAPLPLAQGVSMGMGLMSVKNGPRRPPLLGHSSATGAALFIDPSTESIGFLCLNTIQELSQAALQLRAIMRAVSR